MDKLSALGEDRAARRGSAARHSPDGPPPVRTYECPWGKVGLSVSGQDWHEADSVFGGAPDACSRTWIMRVPGTPSISSLAYATEALHLSGPLMQCVSLRDWHVSKFAPSINAYTGLCATKPTTLMLLRLSTFRDITLTRGNRGRCSHISGHQPLRGIQCNGTFHTAKAKIYPAAMNKAIATAVSRFLTERQLKSNWSRLPEDLQELNCTDLTDEAIIQPDYHQ